MLSPRAQHDGLCSFVWGMTLGHQQIVLQSELAWFWGEEEEDHPSWLGRPQEGGWRPVTLGAALGSKTITATHDGLPQSH